MNSDGGSVNTNLSHLNCLDEVRAEVEFPERVVLYDVTLRDGEQTPGVVFEPEDRVRIARALDNLGVHRIEAGFPVISEGDREGVAAVAAAKLNAEVWGFGRCLPHDVEVNADCGVRNMILEIAISELKMEAYGIQRNQVIDRMLRAMQRARELGISFAFMPVDLTRADLNFAEEAISLAVEEGGASEIIIVDTIGVTIPEAIAYLTQLIRTWVKVPLGIHCHNDFGLALSNSLAALKSGASSVHVSVNCLGERAGNVDLAEVVMSLQLLYGVDLGINSTMLASLARLVEEISGYKTALNKAVVGERIFARESGGVVQQLLASNASVEPYDPGLVGLQRSVVLGKKSGKYSIKHTLERLGLHANDDELDLLLSSVKRLSRQRRSLLNDDDFHELYLSLKP